jgi:predicted DNA-binding protein
MSVLQITLTDKNRDKLSRLSDQTGKTAEQLANEAIDRLPVAEDIDEAEKFLHWREALLQVEGMWKDRDDLPDFAELRKSMDRNPWAR